MSTLEADTLGAHAQRGLQNRENRTRVVVCKKHRSSTDVPVITEEQVIQFEGKTWTAKT